MAFTSESPRFKDLTTKKDSTDLGQVSYNQSDQLATQSYSKKREQYPPFGVGSERDYNKTINLKAQIPGPGQYNISNNFVNTLFSKDLNEKNNYIIIDNGHINRRTQLYGSTNERYKHNQTENSGVGPGHYEVDISSFKQKTSQQQANLSNKRQHHVLYNTSVPSIPSKYNIQEMDDQLSQQSGIRSTQKRLSQDRLGPGTYDVKDAFVKKNSRAIPWNNAQDERCNYSKHNSTSQSIGPGAYNAQSIERKIPTQTFPKESSLRMVQKIQKRKRQNNGSIRADYDLQTSSSDEDNKNNNQSPGPGQYLNDTQVSSFSKIQNRRVGHQVQNFGNSIERFKNVNSELLNELGPGAYNISIEDKRIKRNKILQKAGSSSFAGSQRCSGFDSIKNLDVPGPGQYNPQSLTSKNLGKTSIFFASKLDRFKQKETSNPGPEKYNIPSTFRVQNLSQLHNSSFKSQTKRELQFHIDKEIPGAGLYRQEQYNAIGYEKLQGGAPNNFLLLNKKKQSPSNERSSNSPSQIQESQLSKSMNKTKQYDKKIVSKYDTLLNTTARIKKQKKKTNYEQRIKEQTQIETPGPGSYNDLNKWHKKTFNLKFLNVQLPPYTSNSPSSQ